MQKEQIQYERDGEVACIFQEEALLAGFTSAEASAYTELMMAEEKEEAIF